MEPVDATVLVKALVVAMQRDDDEEFLEYLINNIADATAALMAALDELLKESNKDERTLV